MTTQKKGTTVSTNTASSKPRSQSKQDFTDILPKSLLKTAHYACYQATQYVDQILCAKTREKRSHALFSLIELMTAQGAKREQKMARIFAELQAHSYTLGFPDMVKALHKKQGSLPGIPQAVKKLSGNGKTD